MQESDIKEKKPTSLLSMAIMPVSILFLIIASLILYDRMMLNNQYANQIQYGKDCDYIIPPGYKLEYSKEKGKWAINVGIGNYIWTGNYGLRTMHIDISEPDLFADTCYAKGTLKAYIKSLQPKVNDFK